MKLEIYDYFPDTTPHAKFQGAICLRGWSGQIANFTHGIEVSVLFLVSSPRPQVALWTYPHALYYEADIRTTPPNKWGTKGLPKQHRLPSGLATGHEICSLWSNVSISQRPINFKIDIYLQRGVLVTLPNFGVSRSKILVIRAYNVTWPILRYLIHPQGALVLNSLTIFNKW